MRPAQFGTHCVPNRERLKKSTHMAQIALVKPLSKFHRQARSQTGNQPCAIRRPHCAALLKLNNMPPNFPASARLNHVHPAQGLRSGRRNHATQII
ncbi:hypothetical protein [uncultured Deefgea sp.]|uniref:hypothetical protein n=1 Tax=uncultured Deefgea sp. TaxID=1304914 RepID=UPI00263429F5|nr:hypothetical protein [uncultured Deefgea sp.]